MYLQTPRVLVEGSWIAMFSASIGGGSRGTTLLPGWHPPPTHDLKVQPGSLNIHRYPPEAQPPPPSRGVRYY